MGIPKFASVIRTKYRSCWNNPGDVKYDRKKKQFMLKNDKNNSFRNLLIDGNSLLHMSFQYTYGYGGKIKMTPEHKKFLQTSSYDEIFDQAVKNFCNSIDNMIESLHLQGDVILVFDGPAPLAKMVQQRQRRYGKYYSTSDDQNFQTAVKKEMEELISGMNAADRPTMENEDEEIAQQINANKVGSGRQVVVEIPSVLEDVANRPFSNGGKVYIKELAGGDSTKVMQNLVAWSKANKGMGRWTNILTSNAPHILEIRVGNENKKFLCVKHAAIYSVYKEDNPTDVRLDGLVISSETDEKKHRAYFSTDGLQIPSSDSIFNSVYYKTMDIFERNSSAYLVVNSGRINNAIARITAELAESNPLFKEVLLRTGDSILMSNNRKLNWLMEIRNSIAVRMEQDRIYGKADDMDELLKVLAAQKQQPANEEETYNMEDIYYAEEDDQTHINSKNFDSNCLTPGTKEMTRIAEMIEEHYDMYLEDRGPYGIRRVKIGKYTRKDSPKTKIDIIFSDSSVVGEGEQKLMTLFDDKKFSNMRDDEMDLYYGLDADLFVLTVIRHGMFDKYNGGLLREEEMLRTNFMQPTEKTSYFAEKGLTYHIVDIEVLTKAIQKKIHPYDFAFLSFMFGNDFLPRSPIMSYESMMDNEAVFDKATRLLSGNNGSSKLLEISGYRLNVKWDAVKNMLSQLKEIEKGATETLHKQYMSEKNIRQKNRMKTFENLKKELVPLELKYEMVLKSTAVSQIWKARGIDQDVKRTTDIVYSRFRANWENHIANGFPGFANNRLSRTKNDVLDHACDEYIAGLNWIACYYFNMMGYETEDEHEKIRFVPTNDNKEYYSKFEVLRGNLDIMGDYEPIYTSRNQDGTLVEEIINGSREFILQHIPIIDNAASNDNKITKRCCWDASVFADFAIINTALATAYYKPENNMYYSIAIDMEAEKFSEEQEVISKEKNTVYDLEIAMKDIFKDSRYAYAYILVQKGHPMSMFNKKPIVVAENDKFVLLKFVNMSSPPDNHGKQKLNPYWYYPYPTTPMIASIYDRMTRIDVENHVDEIIKGSYTDIDGRRMESLWTTESDIQCLAVLPPQSSSMYPIPLKENDESIWQFPVKITTRDYNFRGWVHEGALLVPYTDAAQLTVNYK